MNKKLIPKECCEMGTYDCQIPMAVKGRRIDVDICIADIVAALNAANITTVASCCGHGKMFGNILLEDERMITISEIERNDEGIVKEIIFNDIDEDFIQNRFGYCFYEIKEDSALIYNLYVNPEYRLKGKARHLVSICINEIRQFGYCGEIFIQAIPKEKDIDKERLKSFYVKMGLKIKENK